MTQEPTGARRGVAPEAKPPDDGLVPGWLALLVLLLIVAVVGVGGFVVRGALVGDTEKSPVQADIEQLRKELAADPADADARLSLAYAYQRAQRYDEALKEYDLVLKADPKQMAALYNTGVIYMSTGQSKKGEVALWDVLEIDPTHALAAKELGEYYAAKGHYKSLIKAVGPAVEAQPRLADLQALMGLAYENLGQTEQAIERYKLALKYSPDLKRARDGLARLEEASD